MVIFVVVLILLYTVIYGILCNSVWMDIRLCQDCFIFLIINSLAVIMINSAFSIAAKYEMYELISGYDKNKKYDKNLLDNYLKKLNFCISLNLLICSLFALLAPALSGVWDDKLLAVIYANLTFLSVFLVILINTRKNRI